VLWKLSESFEINLKNVLRNGRICSKTKISVSWMQWWLTSIIPALKRLRQEDEFETSLGYMARLSQKKKPIS
jgi:hypothetical protein